MVNWPWSQPKSRRAFALGETLDVKPTTHYIQRIAERHYSWRQKCEEYDRYYANHPEVKSQVLSIAGQATAKGVFLEPRNDQIQLAKDAQHACEQLNEEVGMDQLLYETVIPLVKYGTVLWEKTWSPDPGLQLLPLVQCYVPLTYDHFTVHTWGISDDGVTMQDTLDPSRFAEYSWNRTASSFPYGTSLLAGLGQTLEITEQLIDDIQQYLHKAALPGGLFQIGDETSYPTAEELGTFQSRIKQWEPGYNYATTYAVDYKVVGPATAETRILGDVIAYLKDRLVDGLLMAPISKQYSRTMASMEQMQDQSFLSIVLPVQRLLKRVLERHIYKPYLEQRGYSVRNVPSVSFSPPDEDRDEQIAYFIPLVRSGLMTREAAARELGIKPEDVPKEEDLMAQHDKDDEQSDNSTDNHEKLEELLRRVTDDPAA